MMAATVKTLGLKSWTAVEQVEEPKLEPGEALIRITYAGICNTDLELQRGYMNFSGILGHEFVGTVVECNPSNDALLHQRVCGDINIPCHICTTCTQQQKDCKQIILARNHCPRRTVLGILNKQGSMAQFITLPFTNLHIVPRRLPDTIAVFAEPLAAALRIMEQNLIHFPTTLDDVPSKVAILGDGKLGLMIANVIGRKYLEHILTLHIPHILQQHSTTTAQIHSILQNLESQHSWIVKHRPVLIGKHADKMTLVQEKLVHHVFLSDCLDTISSNGVAAKYSAQFDVVIDATGSPDGLMLAAKLCKPMGNLVVKSTCASGTTFNTAPFVIDELHVVGSRCGPMDKALEFLDLYFYDDGLCSDDDFTRTLLRTLAPLNLETLIHGIYPLKDAIQALEHASQKGVLKILIDCKSE